jgi:glycerol-3-phosphate dehydrogenase
MKRDLTRMAQGRYDVVIVGGGISGAATARDAALRGYSVALVEKGDFGAATSAATSKLAHGGLRYLKNLEFDLVRESLQERRLLEVAAPHLVAPLPFLVPTYKGSGNNRRTLLPGMVLYDLLSYDKGRLDDPDRRCPHFRYLSAQDVLHVEPGVNPDGLTGGVLYYDCQMLSPERLTLAFLQSAAEQGARLATHAETVAVLKTGNRVEGVRVRDRLTGEESDVRGRVTVNCSGPWADIVLGMATTGSDKHVLRSQGIHVVVRPIVRDHALVLLTPSKRHFFILPWRGLTLIGTTDTKYEGDPDRYVVTEEAVADFLAEINAAYPSGKLTRDDVVYAYGGLRPIVEKETKVEVYKASRKYEIYDHAGDEKIEGLVSVIGGKYTTSRKLGQQIVDLVARKLGQVPSASRTAAIPLAGGNTGRVREFGDLLRRDAPGAMPRATVEYLAAHYGALARRVFALIEEEPALAEPLGTTRPDVAAQVVLACREEMARTVLDVVLRRTGIGTIGHPGDDLLAAVADLMARELGWGETVRRERLAEADDHLRRAGIGG